MGCKSSKSLDIFIEYQGSKRQLTGDPPSFDHLNTWILSQFPSLQGRAISLKVNSIPLKSSEDFLHMARKSESLKINLEKVKSLVETQFGVVKFGTSNEKVLGTGFLITKEFILVYISLWNSVKNCELQVIFPDDSEIKLKPSSPPLKLTDFFVALQLEREISSFDPILVSQTSLCTEDQSGTVLFYSKKFPVLQKYTGKFIFKDNTFSSSLILESGGVGSPLISSDNKLLGVYINDRQVFPASSLAAGMKLYVELYQDSLSDSVDSSPQILLDSFQTTTAHLDTRRSRLIYYCPVETIKKSFICSDLMLGSVAISTPYGIMITGTNLKSDPVAFLFNKNALIQITPPNKPHLHHCAVLFHDEFFVISGSSPAVESFNFKSQKWNQVASLSKFRNYSSAVCSAGQIFLFGGRRDAKILRSILRFQNGNWNRLQVFLPAGIMNLGTLEVNNSVLLFGGEGGAGKNKMMFKFNTSYFLIESENCFVCYNFGRALAFQDDGEAVLFSNDGVLVRFDKSKQLFLVLIVDEEELHPDQTDLPSLV
jgi:transcriptional antiterminator Rof (Rho-off)